MRIGAGQSGVIRRLVIVGRVPRMVTISCGYHALLRGEHYKARCGRVVAYGRSREEVLEILTTAMVSTERDG